MNQFKLFLIPALATCLAAGSAMGSVTLITTNQDYTFDPAYFGSSASMAEHSSVAITHVGSGGSVSARYGGGNCEILLQPTNSADPLKAIYASNSTVNITLEQTNDSGTHNCQIHLSGSDLNAQGSSGSYCCPGFDSFNIGIELDNGAFFEDMYNNDFDDNINDFGPMDTYYRPFTNTCPES